MLIITSIIFSIPILFHIINIVFITTKKKLHKPSFYILFNLTISDIVSIIFLAAQCLTKENTLYLDFGLKLSGCASILSTLGITLERYIAVEYCLHYYKIVTTKRLSVFLITVWCTALSSTMAILFSSSNPEVRIFYYGYICGSLSVIACSILLVSSFWIRRIRNKHEKEIKKRNVYFGIHDERLGILANLKASIADIIKLNLITAVLIVLGVVFYLVKIHQCRMKDCTVSNVYGVLRGLYIVSNPFLYILSLRELKEQYLKSFRRQNIVSIVSDACSPKV